VLPEVRGGFPRVPFEPKPFQACSSVPTT
jgi:hypothetical protein